ncbi:MAG: response regulator transcription factor [Sphingobacteriales bacterium]|nr:MAG: response regulator transcription factor [Sphingobacteriales bacterium]
MINIALVEDQVFSRKALEEKLSAFKDITIIHSAVNGAELLDDLRQNDVIDLILMDIEMPLMNGIEATEKIKEMHPHIKVVMITIYDDDDYIFNAIKAGADSYILKETKADKIYEAITDTLNGGAVMSPSIALKTLRFLKNINSLKPEVNADKIALSERETEILEQLSSGASNKVIAENLFISPFTVKRHIENIYQKLQAHNRIELLDKARKNGLI